MDASVEEAHRTQQHVVTVPKYDRWIDGSSHRAIGRPPTVIGPPSGKQQPTYSADVTVQRASSLEQTH